MNDLKSIESLLMLPLKLILFMEASLATIISLINPVLVVLHKNLLKMSRNSY